MDPHTTLLIEAAGRLGLQVRDLGPDWGVDAVEYSLGEHTELVLDGRHYSYLGSQALFLVDQKHLCKVLLEECGLRVPKDIVFSLEEENEAKDIAAAFMEEGKFYVCKPLYGTDGEGVGMQMADAVDVEMHIDNWADAYSEWILEEQVEGKDLRIQVIGGKIAAACVRIPAYVVGDGEKDLETLIQDRNAEMARQNPMNHLEIDADARRLMREQDVYLSSVIEADRKIQLKYVSNMGKGGVAVDVSDALHPDYQAVIDKVADRFSLRTFAFDGIVTDPAEAPEQGIFALELNAKAQWLHHTFSEGKTHDIPTLILRDLFPELG